jgi:hypothetical protein
MTRRRSKVPNTVLYWVVARNEDTKEIVGNPRSFPNMRDAERFKIDFEERRDPPGIITKTSVEVLLIGEFPK